MKWKRRRRRRMMKRSREEQEAKDMEKWPPKLSQ